MAPVPFLTLIRSWISQPRWHLHGLATGLRLAGEHIAEGMSRASRSVYLGVALPPIAGASGEEGEADADGDDEDEADDDGDDEDDSDDKESDDDDEADADDEDDDKGKDKGGKSGKDDSDDEEEEDDGESKSFLKRIGRRNERRYKREKAARERLEREIAKLKKGSKGDDAEDGDDDKIKAKEAELDEMKGELEEERKSYRLEQAVDKFAKKGVEVETGKGKDKKVVRRKFSDPDDVQARIERAISKGDLDKSDVFDDDGRVNREAIEDFMVELAESSPHLLVGATKRSKPKGGADQGKGKGAGGGKDLDEMSPAEHLKQIQGK